MNPQSPVSPLVALDRSNAGNRSLGSHESSNYGNANNNTAAAAAAAAAATQTNNNDDYDYDYEAQTEELVGLFSTTMRSLAADAAAIRQISDMAEVLTEDPTHAMAQQLRDLDSLVSGMEHKASVLQQIVRSEKDAIVEFETTLKTEAEEQRILIEELMEAFAQRDQNRTVQQQQQQQQQQETYHDEAQSWKQEEQQQQQQQQQRYPHDEDDDDEIEIETSVVSQKSNGNDGSNRHRSSLLEKFRPSHAKTEVASRPTTTTTTTSTSFRSRLREANRNLRKHNDDEAVPSEFHHDNDDDENENDASADYYYTNPYRKRLSSISSLKSNGSWESDFSNSNPNNNNNYNYNYNCNASFAAAATATNTSKSFSSNARNGILLKKGVLRSRTISSENITTTTTAAANYRSFASPHPSKPNRRVVGFAQQEEEEEDRPNRRVGFAEEESHHYYNRDESHPYKEEEEEDEDKEEQEQENVGKPTFVLVTEEELQKQTRFGPHMCRYDINEALEEIETVVWKHRKRHKSPKPRKSSFGRKNGLFLDDSYDSMASQQQQQRNWAVSEQELRENCAFFRHGESTARSTLQLLCYLKRLKQIPSKTGIVTYVCLFERELYEC